MSRYRVLALVVGVVSLSCSAQVQAANKIWANPVTGSWATAANWTGGVPTAADSATFNKAGAYTVNFSAVFQNTQNISLTAGTVTFERITTPATLDLGNYELAVSSGTLNLGHSLPVNVSALRTSIFNGTLTVNAGSYLNTYNLYNDGALLVGSPLYGTGQLGVYEEMIVGKYGIGNLAISNGADVTDDNSLVAHEPIIGDQVGSFGDVTVTGAGSTWTMSRNLVVGRLGVGALTISNGGFVGVAAGAGQVNVSSLSRINFGEGGLAGSIQAAAIVNNGNLNINHTNAMTVSAAISGNGRVYKAGGGAGDTTFTNAAAFTGDYYVQSGRLILQGNVIGKSYVATSGGTLRFSGSTLNLGAISLQAGAGGNMEYLGANVRGGFLRGPGTHTVLSGGSETRFTGVTTFNSTHIVQDGNATFTNFSNGGSFISNAPANFDGVVNATSGVITINNDLSAQDFTSNGIITVNNGGSLYTGDSNLVSGGGSRTTINPGGVVFLSDDTSWELNGALLINNGELYGTTNVNYGSLAKGDGVYGVVNVYDGGSFSPGNSPGEVTVDAASFNAGGKYVFEINDAAGVSGVNFDLTTVAGTTQHRGRHDR